MKLLLLSLIAVSSLVAGCEHEAKTPNEVQAVNDYDVAEGIVNYYLKTLAAIAQANRLTGEPQWYETNSTRALKNYCEDAESRAEAARQQLKSLGVKVPAADEVIEANELAAAAAKVQAEKALVARNKEMDEANAHGFNSGAFVSDYREALANGFKDAGEVLDATENGFKTASEWKAALQGFNSIQEKKDALAKGFHTESEWKLAQEQEKVAQEQELELNAKRNTWAKSLGYDDMIQATAWANNDGFTSMEAKQRYSISSPMPEELKTAAEKQADKYPDKADVKRALAMPTPRPFLSPPSPTPIPTPIYMVQ